MSDNRTVPISPLLIYMTRIIPLVCFSALMLMACKNSSKQPTAERTQDHPVVQADSLLEQDTIDVVEGNTADEPASTSSATTSSAHASRQRHAAEQDNLRGFDPAWEDDMPDNGMSRYFENDDDEGWD